MVATFDLAENPFFLLRAGISDPLTTIRERAEDAVADGRTDEGSAARAEQILTAPATRLGAELSGLVGVEPEAARALYDSIARECLGTLRSAIEDLPPLARSNVAAHLSARLRGPDETIQLFAILDRSWTEISTDMVANALEPDRRHAGVRSADPVKVAEALEDLRRRHARVARLALEEIGRARDHTLAGERNERRGRSKKAPCCA